MNHRVTLWTILIIGSICVLHLGCSSKQDRAHPKNNTLVAYLLDAERQSETTEQRLEIKRALQDMLVLSPFELKARRYADYQEHPGVWSVTTLIGSYYVPAQSGAFDTIRFYQEYTDSAAQALIREHLRILEKDIVEDTIEGIQ